MNLSLRPVCRAIAIGAVALAIPVLVPQAASAAVTCHTNGLGVMSVQLDHAGDRAAIERNEDGSLTVNGADCDASVTTVDEIDVADTSGESTRVTLDAEEGAITPGKTVDQAFGSEISVNVSMGGGDDVLEVLGEIGGSQVVVGESAINMNAPWEVGKEDADVQFSGVERIWVAGDYATDRFSGQGGAGTGAPATALLSLQGGGGDDELHGGENPYGAMLQGGSGNDQLIAGSLGDIMEGGPGDDTITGSPNATDVASFVNAPAGVHVDLSIAGPQNTGGAGVDTYTNVDWLWGSEHDDVLKGTADSTLIYGHGGDDVLEGREGVDYLHGDAGDDTLRNGTGEGVLTGDDGEDTVAYDDIAGPVTVDLSREGAPQSPTGAEPQTLSGIEDVIGSPFDDRLFGSAGANAIDGGAGADTIDGRGGSDRIGGGAGIDALESRDGEPDFISCGEGPDAIAADPIDNLAPDCVPPAGPGGGEPAAPVLGISVPHQSLRSVRAHGLRVELTCSAACRAGGRLVLGRAAARRLGIARRAGRLGAVDLAAGSPTERQIRLTRAARRALRHARRARLTLRAHAADTAGRPAAPVRTLVKLRG